MLRDTSHAWTGIASPGCRDNDQSGIDSIGGTTQRSAGNVRLLGGDSASSASPRLGLLQDDFRDLLESKDNLPVCTSTPGNYGERPVLRTVLRRWYRSIRGFAYRGSAPRSGPDDDRIRRRFSFTHGQFSALRNLARVHHAVEPNVRIGTIRSSIGAGVRLSLPFLGQVPIAIDFAIPLTRMARTTRRSLASPSDSRTKTSQYNVESASVDRKGNENHENPPTCAHRTDGRSCNRG